MLGSRGMPNATVNLSITQPRAALRGSASTLCPGLVCAGLSGHFRTRTQDRYPRPVAPERMNYDV